MRTEWFNPRGDGHRSDADNGKLVVCVNNGEALIKRFYNPHDDQVLLESENRQYSPFMAASDFHIEGEVKGVISAVR